MLARLLINIWYCSIDLVLSQTNNNIYFPHLVFLKEVCYRYLLVHKILNQVDFCGCYICKIWSHDLKQPTFSFRSLFLSHVLVLPRNCVFLSFSWRKHCFSKEISCLYIYKEFFFLLLWHILICLQEKWWKEQLEVVILSWLDFVKRNNFF